MLDKEIVISLGIESLLELNGFNSKSIFDDEIENIDFKNECLIVCCKTFLKYHNTLDVSRCILIYGDVGDVGVKEEIESYNIFHSLSKPINEDDLLKSVKRLVNQLS